MIPADVMSECRERARVEVAGRPVNWVGAAVIVAIWLALAALAVAFLLDLFC